MEKVTLKIIGTQISGDGEENQVELITEGKYYEKNNCRFLVYEETELSGMEGSTTTLKIAEGQVMMKRFGTNESELVFEKDQTHTTQYRTPYGAIEMDIVTSEISIAINEECVDCIDIAYEINISEKTETRNTLSVTVKKDTI